MALPTLKSKTSSINSQRSRPNIIKLPQSHQESGYNLQKSVEILESIDFSKTPRHQKSLSFTLQLSKEFSIIEQNLDSQEIFLLNNPIPYNAQFKVYKDYLDSIVNVLKFKENRLSKMLKRGNDALEKIFFRCFDENSVEKKDSFGKNEIHDKKIEKELKDEWTQDDLQEIMPLQKKIEMNFEAESILSLPDSLKKIKISKISNKLADLFENLNNIKTDIPSPSSTPEFEPFQISEKKKAEIKLNLNVIKSNFEKIMEKNDIKKKLMIPKMTQTESEFKDEYVIALENMNRDKDLGIVNIKNKTDGISEQNKNLQDTLARFRKMNFELERKNGEYEITLTRLQTSLNESNEKNKKFEENIQKLQEKVEELTKIKKEMKKVWNLLNKKQKELQNVFDQLYSTQIMWKVSEKKLNQITKRWESLNGNKFVFKDINIQNLVKKSGIKKITLGKVDDEIQDVENLDAQKLSNEIEISLIEKLEKKNSIKLDTVKSKSSKNNSRHCLHSRSSWNESCEKSDNERDMQENESIMLSISSNPRKNSTFLKNEKNVRRESVKNKKLNQTVSFQLDSENKSEIIEKKTSDETKIISEIQSKNEKYSKKSNIEDFQEKQEYIKKSYEKVSGLKIMNENDKQIEIEEDDLKLIQNNEETRKSIPKKKKSLPKDENYNKTENDFVYSPTKISEQPRKKKLTLSNQEDSKINLKNSPLSKTTKVLKTQIFPIKSIEKPLKSTGNDAENSLESNSSKEEELASPTQISVLNKDKSSDSFEKFQQNKEKNAYHPENFEENYEKVNQSKKKLLNDKSKNRISINSNTTYDTRNSHLISNMNIQNLSFSLYDSDSFSNTFDADKLKSSMKQAENEWISSLSPEQYINYQNFITKMEGLKKKIINFSSKAVQCTILKDASIVYEKNYENLELLKKNPEFREALTQVFENSEEFENLPLTKKYAIAKSLKGHSQNKCAEMCEHLKRAMKIKFKSYGKRYPIKIVKI